jgi:hypothetical protein
MIRSRVLGLAAIVVTVLSMTACGATARTTGSGAQASGDVIASFPIPPGATVVARNPDSDGVNIVIASVTSQDAAAFYRQALPRAGWTITKDTQVVAGGGVAATGIEFEGHGYRGSIGGAAAGGPDQNTVGISILRQ